MTPTWTVRRQASPRRDGERRWDQAYQLLVRWAAEQPDGTRPVAPMTQEVPDACRGVRTGHRVTSGIWRREAGASHYRVDR